MARKLLETLTTEGSTFEIYREDYEAGWWRLTLETGGEVMMTLVLPDGDESEAAETLVDGWLKYWRAWS